MSLLSSPSVQIWSGVLFSAYWATFSKYPMKHACCHGHWMFSRGKHLHRFHVRAEGHHQHPLCQLHAGFTHEWVSVKMQFCSIHSSPYTPTGHLLHQMHAGISQPDRLTRWTVQTIRLSADMQNRFKKMGLEETSNSAALNFVVQDTPSCCLFCTMSVQTHRLWCFYVWDECSLF